MSSQFSKFEPENLEDYGNYFINPFFTKWMWLFRFDIKGNQDFLGVLQLYKAFSALTLKHNIFFGRKTDLRLFTIIFSDAGSGKGMTNTLYNEVFGKGLLNIKTVRKPTNEKLVGSWNETANERNMNKGWVEGIHDRWTDPKIPGYFEEYDDVVFEEALLIFERERDIQTTLRCVADNHGDPTNFLSSETLKNYGNEGYFSKSCWGTLSYHLDSPERMSKDLATNGLYQRSLVAFIRLLESQTIDVIEADVNHMDNEFEEYNEEVIKLQNMIERQFQKYTNTKFSISPSAYRMLIHKIKEVRHRMAGKFHTEDELRVLNSYIIRAKKNAIKISCVNAVMNSNPIITTNDSKKCTAGERDVMIGIELISLCLSSVMEEIKPVINREQASVYIKDIHRIMGRKCLLKSQLGDLMSAFWHCGVIKSHKRINTVEYIFEVKKGKGNTKWFKLR